MITHELSLGELLLDKNNIIKNVESMNKNGKESSGFAGRAWDCPELQSLLLNLVKSS